MQAIVFPAYAGMFRRKNCLMASTCGFPRIRGDVPPLAYAAAVTEGFSPHTRGCSNHCEPAGFQVLVFPAYAGMFLKLNPQHDKVSCFPRIRGDVPSGSALKLTPQQFSPHTRGCSCSPSTGRNSN